MAAIGERIRHPESLAKVMTAQDAAMLFRDGMMVATSGSTMGFPKAVFGALAERIKAQEQLDKILRALADDES
jgi:succinyl-CoA:acetate CoA-transferase